MADFLPKILQNRQPVSQILRKRQCFQASIRRQQKQKKIKHLRQVSLQHQTLKPSVNSLPNSITDLVHHLNEFPQHEEIISKLIIDRIYEPQLADPSQMVEQYMLLPQSLPQTIKQFQYQLYLFSILFKFQGMHAPLILRRYFPEMMRFAKSLKAVHFLFDTVNDIVKNIQLNWVPVEEIKEIILCLWKQQSGNEDKIYPDEVRLYLSLTKNYHSIIEETQAIKDRIKFILEKGSACFQFVKPTVFFQLCLNLTYYQNNQNEDTLFKQQNQGQKSLFFHKAMMKGQIIKNLFRQIFFSSKTKIRVLCLQVLRNLLLQFGSSYIWKQQKLNPVQHFQAQIKNQSNSVKQFHAFCEVFLISIIRIPYEEVLNVIQNQVNTLELILYILQNVKDNNQTGKQILELAEESLWTLLLQGNQQANQKVANSLLQSRWILVLGQDSQIIHQCYKVLGLQY